MEGRFLKRVGKRYQKGCLNLIHELNLSSLVCLVLGAICLTFLLMTLSNFVSGKSQRYEDDSLSITKSLIRIPEEKKKAPSVGEEPPKKRTLNEVMGKKREAVKQDTKNMHLDLMKFVQCQMKPIPRGEGLVMLFDSLDTMLLMDLTDEYHKSLEWVLSVNFDKDHDASFFEFTIRYVGGLLGAYELSNDRRLLLKAKEMADRLLWAFNSSTGIPFSIVNLKSHKARNPTWTGGSSILAEFGSVQLEFKYLSHHLQDPIYAEKAEKVMEFLRSENMMGLYPVYLHPETGKFTNDLVSYGGLGDSFYEYLLKQYLLTGNTDDAVRKMYDESVEAMMTYMIQLSSSGLTFLGEYTRVSNTLTPEMDHLVCYVPGMLALGARALAVDNPSKINYEKHLHLAKELMKTCFQLYSEQASGIGPERVQFSTTKIMDGSGPDYKILSARYLLRPETIESLFVLYRATHDEIYRDWGWKIFEAIEKHCKTPSAFSGLLDVTKENPDWNNSMQSFFLAETLKYLYLLFSEDAVVPLNKFVFTTEAHPLGVFDPDPAH